MRYVAFLRAINVGGHVVKMDRLRALFEDMGFANVSTFITSGNVLFESPSRDASRLEARIEAHLKAALGYEVETFLRSDAEIAAVATYQPFPSPGDTAIHVIFARAALGRDAVEKVRACRTKDDEFHVNGREVYWLAGTGVGRTAVNTSALGKATGLATARNMNTVRRLAALHAGGPAKDEARKTTGMKTKAKASARRRPARKAKTR